MRVRVKVRVSERVSESDNYHARLALAVAVAAREPVRPSTHGAVHYKHEFEECIEALSKSGFVR